MLVAAKARVMISSVAGSSQTSRYLGDFPVVICRDFCPQLSVIQGISSGHVCAIKRGENEKLDIIFIYWENDMVSADTIMAHVFLNNKSSY